MSNEQSCAFCNIVAGIIPAEKVYEDDVYLAFLDINPETAGHTQIIPKEHYRWVWDLPTMDDAGNDEPSSGGLFELGQRIAKAQQKTFNTDWILSKVVGDEVSHAHLWIFPGDASDNKRDIAGNAEKIRAEL